MSNRSQPVIVETTLNASREEVWNAITQPAQMKQWYFGNIPDFKPEVGFETKFNVKAPSRDFMHNWKVTEVVPQEKLVYRWTFDEIPGESYSNFELEEEQGKTKLTLTSVGLENMPEEYPEFTRESCLGGWNYFIKQCLTEYINDKKP
jgi:uncharacterized protein YndB with AHSA1/START domain